MKNKRFWLGMSLMALVFVVVLTGCATRIGDFTVMSSKNVELSRLGEFTRSKIAVKGTDSKITVLGFIPIKTRVDLKEALDSALNKIPGAQAIVDVRLYYQKMDFLLFQIEGFVVSGTALIDPRVSDASEKTSDEQYLVLETNDGKDFSIRYVNEDEYNQYLAALK